MSKNGPQTWLDIVTFGGLLRGPDLVLYFSRRPAGGRLLVLAVGNCLRVVTRDWMNLHRARLSVEGVQGLSPQLCRAGARGRPAGRAWQSELARASLPRVAGVVGVTAAGPPRVGLQGW